MELITESFHLELIRTIHKANESLTIISPYISKVAVSQVIECLHERKLKSLRLVTLPPGKEYVNGATEPEVLLLMKNVGFEVQMLERLHAKIYCIDYRTVFISSANLTSKGLSLIPHGNREIMLKLNITPKQLNQIDEEYWDEASKTHITQLWLERINEFISSLNRNLTAELSSIDEEMRKRFSSYSPYEELLQGLQQKGIIKSYEHKTNGYLKHVYKLNNRHFIKVLRSKQGTQTDKKFQQVFNYQVQEKVARCQQKLKCWTGVLDLTRFWS